MNKENEKQKIDITYGKTFPNDQKAEEAILGALLVEEEKTYSEVASIFEGKEMFYYEKHNTLWKAIENIINKKEEVDLVTVVNELRVNEKLNDVGGPVYIAKLSNNIGSGAHVKNHARIIKQLYTARQLISISNTTMQRAYDLDDVFSIYKDLDLNISNLFGTETGKAVSINDAIDNSLHDIKGRMEGTAMTRIKTNSCFDEIIDISPNELIWIGALPKAGKTKTMIKLISAIIKENENVAINWYSMEDDQTKLIANIASLETKIKTKVILGKDDYRLTDESYDTVKSSLSKYRDYDLKIAYGTHTVDQVFLESKNFVRQRKSKFNIIIIDNFNILRDTAKGQNSLAKEDYVAAKIQQLKLDTNSEGLSTCIFVLDHLNKEASKDLLRMAGRPAESTLTGTGRKTQVLTQLLSVNKPSEFPELVSEEHAKKPLIIRNTVIDRKRIFDNLIIYESLKSRENSSVNKILRVVANFDNMQFQSLDNFIDEIVNGKNSKKEEITIEENAIDVTEQKELNEPLNLKQEKEDVLDTTFLEIKEDVEDVPF